MIWDMMKLYHWGGGGGRKGEEGGVGPQLKVHKNYGGLNGGGT